MKSLFAFLLAALFSRGTYAEKKNLHFEVDGVSFKMIFVKGGTFTMGGTFEQTAPLDNEKPLHEVRLSDYYIGETEVTQELWNAVTEQPLSHFTGDGQLPVEDVSGDECMEFIRRLQHETGAKFCLPTEAQWEFAARGGNGSHGYQYAGSDTIDEVAWYGAGERPDDGICRDTINIGQYLNLPNAHTYPVAQKMPNELGLYDMSGNVTEWTADYYSPYSERKQKNPKGPAYGTEHVFRGGCWYFGAWSSRVAQRQGAPSSAHFINLGFRLALPKYYKM